MSSPSPIAIMRQVALEAKAGNNLAKRGLLKPTAHQERLESGNYAACIIRGEEANFLLQGELTDLVGLTGATAMAGPAGITVDYRCINGYHVYTSTDVYGLYVANSDPEAAYNAVGPSLEKLIKLNEGIVCRVRPMMTFSELVNSVRRPNEQVVVRDEIGRAHV